MNIHRQVSYLHLLHYICYLYKFVIKSFAFFVLSLQKCNAERKKTHTTPGLEKFEILRHDLGLPSIVNDPFPDGRIFDVFSACGSGVASNSVPHAVVFQGSDSRNSPAHSLLSLANQPQDMSSPSLVTPREVSLSANQMPALPPPANQMPALPSPANQMSPMSPPAYEDAIMASPMVQRNIFPQTPSHNTENLATLQTPSQAHFQAPSPVITRGSSLAERLAYRNPTFVPRDDVASTELRSDGSQFIVDVENEQKMVIDLFATTYPHLLPEEIYSKVMAYIRLKYNDIFSGLSMQQIKARVHATRSIAFGSGANFLQSLETYPNYLCLNSNLSFFQFQYSSPSTRSNGTAAFDRILCFAHPSNIHLLKYDGINAYIDGTFQTVPDPFYQMVTIMVLDQGSKMYHPCVHFLLTAKTSVLYFIMIQFLINLSNWEFDPSLVSLDFEEGLVGAIEEQFPDADISGCEFHWKACIQDRCKKRHSKKPEKNINIPKEKISYMMRKNKIDLLTIIPEDEVATKGIPFLQHDLETGGTGIVPGPEEQKEWKKFWDYMTTQWMSRTRLFNVHRFKDRKYRIWNRTNNPLESFHARLKRRFNTNNPNFAAFVQQLKGEADYQIEQLEAVRKNPELVPYRLPITIPDPPVAYTRFVESGLDYNMGNY